MWFWIRKVNPLSVLLLLAFLVQLHIRQVLSRDAVLSALFVLASSAYLSSSSAHLAHLANPLCCSSSLILGPSPFVHLDSAALCLYPPSHLSIICSILCVAWRSLCFCAASCSSRELLHRLLFPFQLSRPLPLIESSQPLGLSPAALLLRAAGGLPSAFADQRLRWPSQLFVF